MDTGNSTLKFLLIVLIIILALGTFYYLFNRKQGASYVDERTVKPLNITAENNKFNPSDIKTTLFGDLNLMITAVDKDYAFHIDDYPRFDTTIKKGETKKIELYSLGVGEYAYTCGINCAGTIIVEQKNDED